MANSIIEAQDEFFDGRILQMAPYLPASMLFWRKYDDPKIVAKEEAEYRGRCREYIADQQRALWDYKLQEENESRIQE